MTYDDYKRFMVDSQNRLPALRKYLKAMDEDAGRKNWNAWFKILQSVPTEAIDAAFEKMAGDTSLQVFGDRWDQFPAKLLQIVGDRNKAKPHRAPRCQFCQGDRIIEVGTTARAFTIAGNEMRQFLQNGETLWGPFGAACRCTHGQALNELRSPQLATYDERTMRQYRQSVSSHCDQMERVDAIERASLRQASLRFGDDVDASSLDVPQYQEF